MNIGITGKNVELSPSLRQYCEDKFSKLQNLFDYPLEIDVILSVQATKKDEDRHICDVNIWANGAVLKGTESSPDMYQSIDLVLDILERQLKRHKDKQKYRSGRKGKHKDSLANHAILEMPSDYLPDPGKEFIPKIIRTNRFALKPMFVDEAVVQLEIQDQEFFVFANAKTDQVNVVYKRNDGNFGLIEPIYG